MDCSANEFGIFLASFVAGAAALYFYLRTAGKLVAKAPKGGSGGGGGGRPGDVDEQEN